MQATPQQLAQLLRDNPTLVAAHNDTYKHHDAIRVYTATNHNPFAPLNTRALPQTTILRDTCDQFRPLITDPHHIPGPHSHTTCQNEPIQLGTQLQPSGAPWVGTAGLPVKWRGKDNNLHWGILSNWHVMVPPNANVGHTQHQPDDRYPACARLSAWSLVSPDATNTTDAALADALIEGYHTIAPNILEVGPAGDQPIDAAVGLEILKSGRTTGLTHGNCTAVGAAVRVGYGDFEAIFTDQDIFAGQDTPLSAPGDSGSAILARDSRRPCSLLFAGNDQITVANPMRHITEAFNLVYPFP